MTHTHTFLCPYLCEDMGEHARTQILEIKEELKKNMRVSQVLQLLCTKTLQKRTETEQTFTFFSILGAKWTRLIVQCAKSMVCFWAV